MKIFTLRFLLLALLASGLLNAGARAATSRPVASPAPANAKLSYRRIFKSSSPEFIEIIVRDDSDAATYEIRQLDEDPGATPFEVGAALRDKMFELAGGKKGESIIINYRCFQHNKIMTGKIKFIDPSE